MTTHHFFKAKKKRKIALIALVIGLIWLLFALPDPLFKNPVSIVIEDENGRLLGARLATDQQWRFPQIDSVPESFAQAIISFEDKRFYQHFGVDMRSMSRAIRQNLKAKRVISGASTLDMQVMRMAYGNKKRTIWQKLIESILAIRLNFKYTKKEILSFYASNAPFGGNIVGLEAASWRYYGKSPQLLSVGESAVLAVLPNNPSLVRPGKNEKILLRKRNKLLDKLWKQGVIDSITCVLSKDEPLPGKPLRLPSLAPHLLNQVIKSNRTDPKEQSRIKTTINKNLQTKINQVVELQLRRLKANEVNNCAILVLDVETGHAKAYVGNAITTGHEHGARVDIIQANRSTGSVLKPILAGLALDDGLVMDKSLVRDIPTQYGQYSPENFNNDYAGVLPLDDALIRSLNIPFVRLLRTYGIDKFHHNLKKLGLKSLVQSPDYYGLTLIVGGAETSPWQVGSAYASLARTLRHFYDKDGAYKLDDVHSANYVLAEKVKSTYSPDAPVMSAGAIWTMFEMMKSLKRPNNEGEWQRFGTGRPVAWKTGTSIGFRDAWAMGLDRDFVVVVWTGNANGEGRAGLTGVNMAAPILFDVFKQLPQGKWFDAPYDELKDGVICAKSGYLAKAGCPLDTVQMLVNNKNLSVCTYHQLASLDSSHQYRVTRDCIEREDIEQVSIFTLRPIEAFYYKRHHPDYQGLPPFRKGCEPNGYKPIQLIYPRKASKIFVPIGLEGEKEKTIFEVAYDYPKETLYWHLDDHFLGKTKHFHQMALSPKAGKHILTIVDKDGHRLVQHFEIITRNE